jgi:AhpD family alkylhydroperoxidase
MTTALTTTTTARELTARMPQPAYLVPGAMDALLALGKAIGAARVPETTRELAHIRASQINGCGVCLVQHPRSARKLGVDEDKLSAIAGWRDAPYFDDSERAALELAEAVTRLADRGGAVPDDTWERASAHFDEQQLAALVLSIAAVNLWNRLNVATKQVAGLSW